MQRGAKGFRTWQGADWVYRLVKTKLRQCKRISNGNKIISYPFLLDPHLSRLLDHRSFERKWSFCRIYYMILHDHNRFWLSIYRYWKRMYKTYHIKLTYLGLSDNWIPTRLGVYNRSPLKHSKTVREGNSLLSDTSI